MVLQTSPMPCQQSGREGHWEAGTILGNAREAITTVRHGSVKVLDSVELKKHENASALRSE